MDRMPTKVGSLYNAVFLAPEVRADARVMRGNADTSAYASADWELVTAWMTPKALLHPPPDYLNVSVQRLENLGLTSKLLDWYIDAVRSHFVMHALPAVKGHFSDPTLPFNLQKSTGAVQGILTLLCDALNHYMHPLMHLFHDNLVAQARFRHSFNAMIDIALSEYEFQICSLMLVDNVLSESGKKRSTDEDSAEEEDDDAMMEDKETQRHEFLVAFRTRVETLGVQDLIERTVAKVYHFFIQRYIHENYANRVEREEDEPPALTELRELIYGPIARTVQALVREDEAVCERMFELATECLARLRIGEMFNIVIGFPDSIPGLEDLKSCIKTQEHRTQLVSSFQASCQQRLLHCGVNTTDIILFYISTIKVFRLLDPRGVLLDKVSRPIRRYLRERDDTVKCIVNGLLEVDDPNTGDLSELGKELANVSGHKGDADDDNYADMNWVPDPVDAAPDFRNQRSTDFVGEFLSLYENKEVFVKEIVTVIANRLLELKNYEIDREIMHLELIKLRFGEADLHNCDVMIKDISESKRVDANIHDQAILAPGIEPVNRVFHATMLSRLFWPAFKNEELVLPPEITEQMERYAAKFSTLKSGRKLSWLTKLGSVDVTLELEDRTLRFSVSPDRASMIYLFQSSSTLTISEMMQRLRLDEATTRRAALFWVKNGVLKEEGDSYVLLEKAQESTQKVLMDETAQSSVQTAEEKATEEMRVYWSYIVGMLTNLNSLPIDRIQSFLKMLIPKELGYSRSIDELRDFLAVMIAEERLELAAGAYRLRNFTTDDNPSRLRTEYITLAPPSASVRSTMPSSQVPDRRQHIVIVGAGIVGVCTAYYLTRHPAFSPKTHRITILESTRPASGASGKAGGLLALWAFPSQLVPLSFKLHEDLAEEYNGEDEWAYRRLQTVSLEGNLSKSSRVSKKKPVDLDLPEDLDWVREDVLESWSSLSGKDSTAQVHPYKFTMFMLRRAQECGAVQLVMGKATQISYASKSNTAEAVIYTPAGATGIASSGDSISSTSTASSDTQSKILRGDKIVVTVGPWTSRLLPTCPVSGLRAHSITITPSRPVSAYALFTELKLSKGKYISPEIYARKDEVYICGEGDNYVEVPETTDDVEVLKERCEELVKYAGIISKELLGGKITRRQACYLPVVDVPSTSGPLIGPTNTQNLYVASGHSCWGINNAPGTGKVMAEILLEGEAKSADVSSLDPRRYFVSGPLPGE